MKKITIYIAIAFIGAVLMASLPARAAEDGPKIIKLDPKCAPFAPAGSVKLDKDGKAPVKKDGSLAVTQATAKEIADEKKRCENKKIRETVEPLYFAAPEGGAPAAEPRTEAILIGPGDGTAYASARYDIWFGVFWDPAPGSSHILCITKDTHLCPTDPGAVNGSHTTVDYYASMVETGQAVRDMPRFCYGQNGAVGDCLWSIAACQETRPGSWSCQYANPFWHIRAALTPPPSTP